MSDTPEAGHSRLPAEALRPDLESTNVRTPEGKPSGVDAQTEQRVRLRLSQDLAVSRGRIDSAVDLLDGGATVPFIARYRKEATQGLDDTQLRLLEERLLYLRDLESRRETVVSSIAQQGKLTETLKAALDRAATKQELEDLYLPYKPRRRTRAQAAREAGLEPLADALLADRSLDPKQAAVPFIDTERGVPDVKAALDGARDILSERFAESPEVLAAFRTWLWEEGRLVSRRSDVQVADAEKFRDYFEHAEPIRSVPAHRALALFRGRQLQVLNITLTLGDEQEAQVPHPCVRRLASLVSLEPVLQAGPNAQAADSWLAEVLRWCWRVRLQLHLEGELFAKLRDEAQAESIRVFAANLKDLLLGAPAGARTVLGLDPGVRTGVKLAVVDATGRLLETATVFPHEPRRDWDGSLATLASLCRRHGVQLLAIGNGTASRETDRLAADLLARHPDLGLSKVMVSEAGASVYSASALAAREFPELDVSLRGAVSIARRLQDPLAELVKIDPKSIGVGQYQHDVDQRALARSLDAVVEDCVNAVGVDLNTASVPLLARVSGLSASVAERIVAHRDACGPFASRQRLKDVPRLGDKTFEQAAGFLRIIDGENPLDASAVHPEAYAVVQRVLKRLGCPAREVIGRKGALQGLAPDQFTDAVFGLPTVRDIFAEIERPGRDPRGEFVTASFREGINRLSDLVVGMLLEGVVTNVANFGAFVDIGVHQDGLVHVSALSDRFVRDPREVVRAGQVVQVKVMQVDLQRQRIALSMRLTDEPGEARDAGGQSAGDARSRRPDRGAAPTRSPSSRPGPAQDKGRAGVSQTAMQAAFEALRKR